MAAPAQWIEAWSLPGVGTFEKKVGPIHYSNLQVNRRLNKMGTGSFTVPYGYDRLNEICNPASNVETLIRVFEDGQNVYSFFARFRDIDYETPGSITISGPGIEDALEKTLLYPFDWAGSDFQAPSSVTGESLFVDTIYNGDNILANPGFETAKSNETQLLYHDYRHTTDLNGAIDDVTTTIVVTDGSGFPASNFRIVVGSEWIDVGTRSGNTLSGCTRGQYGTTATSHADATQVDGGGKFTLTYSGQTTGNLDWNATPAEIEAALILLTNIVDVDVQGEGLPWADGNPWFVEFVDPGGQDLALMTYTNVSLTSGTAFTIEEYWGGGKGVADPWTKSYNPNSGIEHGGYDVFSPGSVALFGDPAHSGDSALGIDPNAGGPDNFPGMQQIVPVQPAGIYQAGGWFYPVGGGVWCALVVRDLNESLVAKQTTWCPADTWTQITIANVVPDINVKQVIFRMAALNNTTVGFWMDDAEFREGLAASSAGQIVQNLWTTATAQSRSVLSWLRHDSFDGSTDSDGVAWDTDLSVAFPAGMSWLQILDELVNRGYEWKIEWNGTQYELFLYNNGGLGTTRTQPKLAPPNIYKTIVRNQAPDGNAFLGQGSNQIVNEVTDATLIAAYGRRERYHTDPDALDAATLINALDYEKQKANAQKNQLKATLDAKVGVGPGLDMDLGDIVPAAVEPLMSETNLRVMGYLLVVNGETGESEKVVDVGKFVLKERLGGTTSAPTSEALNFLLRQFRRLSRVEKTVADVVNLVPSIAASGTAGRPLIVAASNAPDAWKAVATYTCDGTDDGQEIDDAFGSSPGAYVLLSPGDFYVNMLSRPVVLDTNDGGILAGCGQFLTNVHVATAGGATAPITLGFAVTIRDLAVLDDVYTSGTYGISVQGAYCRVVNVYHYGPEWTLEVTAAANYFTADSIWSDADRGLADIQAGGYDQTIANCHAYAYNILGSEIEGVIRATQPNAVRIIGNYLEHSDEGGIGNHYANAVHIRVPDVSGAIDVAIVGNDLVANDGGVVIALNGSGGLAGLTITGNTIPVGDVGVDVVGTTGALTRASISGNAIYGNMEYGVRLTADFDGVAITGNVFSGGGMDYPVFAGDGTAGKGGLLVTGNILETANFQAITVDDVNGVELTANLIGSVGISGGTAAIVVDGGSVDVLIQENRIATSDTYGIQIAATAACSDIIIRGNHIHQCDSDGIHAQDVTRLVIADNHLFDTNTVTGTAAIYADGTTAALQRGVSIVDNSIDAVIGEGIRISDHDDIVVRGNRITRNRDHGIQITDCQRGLVQGNLINPLGNQAASQDGIHLAGDTDNLLITGNQVTPDGTTATRYGVNVSVSTCDDNLIVGNDLRGTWGTAPIGDSGTGTLLNWPADATYGDNFT